MMFVPPLQTKQLINFKIKPPRPASSLKTCYPPTLTVTGVCVHVTITAGLIGLPQSQLNVLTAAADRKSLDVKREVVCFLDFFF